ncbi:MAG: hypothetical protein V3V28_13925 [Polaribacter sp.]|uniref:hypothetical protein n=1 Tax=Polaribacter sp. TaxID=1920175 RepID=UPI002F35CD93
MISTFLKTLESSNIKYVHWKSNTNIEQALGGVDDLDILVDPADQNKLEIVFNDLMFLRAFSTKDKWQDGITHYIGLDIPSKKLVHVHLHYKLSLGYDYDKCFKLPIVEKYIKNSVNYKNNVFLPSYENEYCILIIRLVLKNALTPFLLMLPHRQINLFKYAKSLGVIQGGGYREFIDLRSKIDSGKIVNCLENNFSFLSKETFNYLELILNDNSSVFAFFKAGRKLKKELKEYRDYNEFTSIRKAFVRLYSIRFFSLLRRFSIYNKIEGKKAENGGRIIAFVGGDGAGKTTTISNLRKTIKSQFSLKSIHVGKPNMTLKGLVFRVISKMFSIIRLKNLSKALFYVSIAINRKNEFKKACKLRDKGVIVLQDRIPLEGITAMDCPRVHTLLNGKYKKLSKFEKKQYQSIKGVDMLFVMKLDPEIALQRRPEDDPDELRIRSGQIWNNNWVAPFAYEINTGENNQEQVQNILLKKVWKNLNTPFIRAEIIGVNGTGKSTLFKKIEQKNPNVIKSMPVKDYPFLIIKGLFFSFSPAFKMYFKTKNTSLLRNYFHLIISLQLLKFWNKKNRIPSKNFIFDQGPYFQAALLYKEKCISKSLYLKYISELQEIFPLIFTLTASNEVLYERVNNRKSSDGRGQHMCFEDFCNFCNNYKKSYKFVRKKSRFSKKINTEGKSIKEVYKSFKKKAYGSIKSFV